MPSLWQHCTYNKKDKLANMCMYVREINFEIIYVSDGRHTYNYIRPHKYVHMKFSDHRSMLISSCAHVIKQGQLATAKSFSGCDARVIFLTNC